MSAPPVDFFRSDEAPSKQLARNVAGRYAVGIDELRRKNHLETETVASGTILEIPVAGT